MLMHRRAVLACALCAIAATTASGQGSTGGAVTTDKQERSGLPKHDSRQQREDSLKADQARKSGEMGTQPSSPVGSGPMRPTSTNQVQGVQAALKAHGHDPGPIDGVMGRRTQEALRAYQTAQHLKATGRIDQETLDKLGVGRATRQP